jgi:hypothetical protein
MFEFQSTIKADDNIDIPEEFKGLYGQGEDESTLVLNKVLAKKLDVSGLQKALTEERKLHGASSKALKEWKRLADSPDDMSTKLQEMTDELSKGTEGKANFDKLKEDLERGHKKQVGEKDEELGGMRKSLDKYLIQSEAAKAIGDLKGKSLLLMPHIMSKVKVIKEGEDYFTRVIDGDGDPRGDGKGGFMGIKDLVKEMQLSEDYAVAFEGSGRTGGGTPPGGGQGKLPPKSSDMTPTQKIEAGLRKMQK